jgi:hypothetical protein
LIKSDYKKEFKEFMVLYNTSKYKMDISAFNQALIEKSRTKYTRFFEEHNTDTVLEILKETVKEDDGKKTNKDECFDDDSVLGINMLPDRYSPIEKT